jgi:hypothetical protein
MPASPAKIYRDALLPLMNGLGLWYPSNEVHVGDVGYLRQDGTFRRLFNILVPSTDPLNESGVPKQFSTWTPDAGEIYTIDHVHTENEPLMSEEVNQVEVGVGGDGSVHVFDLLEQWTEL